MLLPEEWQKNEDWEEKLPRIQNKFFLHWNNKITQSQITSEYYDFCLIISFSYLKIANTSIINSSRFILASYLNNLNLFYACLR